MRTKVTINFNFDAIGNAEQASGQAEITTEKATYKAKLKYFDETAYGDDYGKGIDVEIMRDGETIRCESIDLKYDICYYRLSRYGIEENLPHDLALMVEGYERKNK